MINIISGEKIQDLCDIFFGHEDDFCFNPLFKQSKKQLNYEYFFVPIDNPRYIFSYTHRLDMLYEKIHLFKNPFILVCHNSDHELNSSHLQLINHPSILHIFSQNCNIHHPKVSYLPIGIANRKWAHGNIDVLYDVMQQKNPKVNEIYFQFSMTCLEREKQRRDLLSQGFREQSPLPYKQYLQELSTYKYCFCPRGNGLDTHRFWECIYLNVIPICERNTLTEMIQKEYPQIVLVDTFNELPSYLQYTFPDFQVPIINLKECI
jgi:hypothetical protein